MNSTGEVVIPMAPLLSNCHFGICQDKIRSLFNSAQHPAVNKVLRTGEKNQGHRLAKSSIYPDQAEAFRQETEKASEAWKAIDLSQEAIEETIGKVKALETTFSNPLGYLIGVITLAVGIYFVVDDWKHNSKEENTDGVKQLAILGGGLLGASIQAGQNGIAARAKSKKTDLIEKQVDLSERKGALTFLMFVSEVVESFAHSGNSVKTKKKVRYLEELLKGDFLGKKLVCPLLMQNLGRLKQAFGGDPQKENSNSSKPNFAKEDRVMMDSYEPENSLKESVSDPDETSLISDDNPEILRLINEKIYPKLQVQIKKYSPSLEK